MAYIYDLVDNWNNAGVTFTAIKMNVTDSASSADSLLMDLQVGGASRFSVRKTGGILLPTGSLSAPAIQFGTSNAMAMANFGGNNIQIGQVGFPAQFQIAAGQLVVTNSFGIGGTVTTPDLFLTRRAAANLRLGAADTSASATITVTIASPGVVTWSNHGLSTGSPVVFSTDGALPTGITAGTTYYVIAVDGNTFQLATSFANALAGTAVNTSGSQSGTHTGRRGAIAQTLGVQDTLSTGSLENIDGADFVIRGSRGIGNKPGGSIVFQVAPAGSSGTAQGTLATALTINSARRLRVLAQGGIGAQIAGAAIGSSDNTGIYFGNDNSWVGVQASNGELFAFASGASRGLYIPDTGAVAWSSGPYPGYNALNGDVFLRRDAADTLAQRRDNNGQTFRLYGRFTDITNSFERFFISAPTANGSAVLVGTQKGATTGSARALEFQTDSVTRMTIANTGNTTFANTVSVPSLVLPGSSSGTVTIQPAAAAGTYTLTLPTDDGNAGQALITDGSGILSWAAGGTKSLTRFTPLDNQPPATNFATLDTRNSVATLDFDDGGTNEEAVFVGVIPEGATLTSGIKARIFWTATSATSGQVEWGAQFEKYGTDIDTDSFDTGTFANTVTSGTSGIVNLTEITCTTIDSLVAGDQFRLKIIRNSSDTTDDTMTGDAELIAVELQQVA